MKIPNRWQQMRHLFATRDKPLVLGVSGGRTSAMMAALADDRAILCFENTGREHPRTYDFLRDLDAALGGRIVWLEYRAPPEGAPPSQSTWARVNYDTADRTGKPFAAMLAALASFRRREKDMGPISPWARSRICTAYLKQRVQECWLRDTGVATYEHAVGLRADEPERVVRYLARQRVAIPHRCPLSEAGITKADVLAFWHQQDFDLQVEERHGNCTGCFLKDEGDLARVMLEPESDWQWWQGMADLYPNFGGVRFRGYGFLRAEGRLRLSIEATLRDNRAPVCPPDFDPVRFRLIVIQERRRLQGQVAAFSCSCEGSTTLARMDDDEERQYLLDLWGAA